MLILSSITVARYAAGLALEWECYQCRDRMAMNRKEPSRDRPPTAARIARWNERADGDDPDSVAARSSRDVAEWLGSRDSNPNYLIQSQASYR